MRAVEITKYTYHLVYLHWAGPLNTSLCTEYEPVGDGAVKGRVAAHS